MKLSGFYFVLFFFLVEGVRNLTNLSYSLFRCSLTNLTSWGVLPLALLPLIIETYTSINAINEIVVYLRSFKEASTHVTLGCY